MCYLVAPRLALAERAPEILKGFEKERFDVMRLKPARLCSLHILTDAENAADVHRVGDDCPLLDQVLELGSVESVFDRFGKASADFGQITVTNRLQKQFA